jgi:hypothetical protein
MTECLVTVCGHPDPSKRNRFSLNGVLYEVDGVISTSSLPRQILHRLLVSGSDNALVILVGATERAIANAILNGYCDERLKAAKETFCRVSLVVGDGIGSDAVQYDCERASDVEAITSENDTAKVVSATITSTVASPETFQFSESRLTMLFCTPESCEELPKIVDTIAHQLRIVPRLILCHVQTPDEKTLQSCLRFRSQCPGECFGVSEVVPLAVRLRDVRSWVMKVNEFLRLTPPTGPTLLHLNPTSSSDKLAHEITEGCSFIVGSSDDANAFDLVLSPTGSLDSVWSPHCRLRNEGGQVFIRPECGLTYVNGVLLADEVVLEANDRVAIGTEVLLRFANIMKERDPTLRRIVDWSTKAVEEFVHESPEAPQSRGEGDRSNSFLVLTNPPENNSLSNVWSLENLEEGVSINIGNGLDIAAPIKGRATLAKDDDGYIITIGSTTKRIYHGSRFLVGESLFLLNDVNRKKNGVERLVSPSESTPLPFSVVPSLLVDLRNELFDLQWTVSMLFDFTFPINSSDSSDPHVARRKFLSDDSTVTADRFAPPTLISTLKNLTEALRLVGSQLSSESFSNEGDVNPSLLRALHERNRTIEQLLLGTDSSAPVAWRQLVTLQQSLGDKLIRLANLENRDVEPTSVGATCLIEGKKENVPESVLSLKALVTIPTPSVARRLASTVESMSRSTNVRQLWDRYCRDLDALIESSGGAHNIQPNKQQSVLLALLDVLLAFESGLKQGWVVQGDRTHVDRRIATWRIAAEQCCVAFAKPTQSARKPTPSPQTKSRLASPVSSRQPSPMPSPVSRGVSKDRVAPNSLVRGTRTVSPLQRVPQSINVSPAAVRSGISNKAPSSVPLTARSTASRTSVRGQSPLGDRSAYSPLQRQLEPQKKMMTRANSPSTTVRPARALSPKTLLTKQLLEMEVGNYKRRT